MSTYCTHILLLSIPCSIGKGVRQGGDIATIHYSGVITRRFEWVVEV